MLMNAKQEAWLLVGQLAQRALDALVQVNEGPCEQAKLMFLVEKSEAQVRAWADLP